MSVKNLTVVIALLLCVGSAEARSSAQGAVVLRDGAPVFAKKQGDKVKRTFDRGDVVVGLHRIAIVWEYELFDVDGRTMVGYPRENSARMETGWMNTDDLEGFLYSCGCGDDNCIPLKASLHRSEWNPCFLEAATEAVARLDETPPQSPEHGRRESAAADEDALTNDDIVKLVAAGLDDDLVIAKIRQAQVEALDVSSDALIDLKNKGISPDVLAAMLERAGQR